MMHVPLRCPALAAFKEEETHVSACASGPSSSRSSEGLHRTQAS